jgi:type I site-specific restriction endonuclease
VDKIFVDEAHHSTTESYRNVLRCGGFLDNDHRSKLLVGVTATPQRSDGKALAELYEKVAFVYSIRQAIEEGYLVDVRGFSVSTDTSLDGVGKASGDFKRDELEDAVNNPRRNSLVVKSWQNLAGKRQSVVFCVGIKHAIDLARVFEESGVVATAVWGDDPDRAEKLRLHREGKIQVLCNCSVLVEGYDDPSISCIVLARPTQSGVLFTQMVGRGTRLHPNKSDLIVLDVVDASSRHSLVTLPTLMGLPGILDIKGRSLLSVVREIENELEKHPSVDVSKLKSIDDLKATIASINMFDVRFPEEVEANSALTWFKAADGGYAMRVPKENDEDGNPGKTGRVTIRQNMLDQWELFGKINGKHFHGVRSSMEEAFKVADEQIRQRVRYKQTLSAVKREATWHKNKASEAQMKLLKKFFPWQTFPADLTKGQASRILGERIAGKAK